MARKLKPLKVDTCYFRQSTIDLFLDRDEKVFFGMVASVRIEAPDIDTCKKKMLKALEEQTKPDWNRVIWIDFTAKDVFDDGAAALSLKYDRFEVAKRQLFGTGDVGKYSYWKRPWLEDFSEENRALFVENDRRWDTYDGDSKRLIPYREEVWLALQEIERVIHEAGKRIQGLVDTDDGVQQLAAAGAMIGQLLLAPPK